MILNGTPQSQAAFINWLRTQQPRAYALIMSQPSTLGDWSDTISNVFKRVTETVSKLAPVYIESKAQYELLKLNIERAKAGQMPVQTLPGQTGGAVIDPNAQSFTSGLPSWAIPAAIGAVLFLFFMRR